MYFNLITPSIKYKTYTVIFSNLLLILKAILSYIVYLLTDLCRFVSCLLYLNKNCKGFIPIIMIVKNSVCVCYLHLMESFVFVYGFLILLASFVFQHNGLILGFLFVYMQSLTMFPWLILNY